MRLFIDHSWHHRTAYLFIDAFEKMTLNRVQWLIKELQEWEVKLVAEQAKLDEKRRRRGAV